MKIFVDSYLGERKNKRYADFKTVKMQVKYSLGFFIFHNLATSFKRKLTEQKHRVELSNRKQINKVNKCMRCVHIIMLTIIALKKLNVFGGDGTNTIRFNRQATNPFPTQKILQTGPIYHISRPLVWTH